MRMQQPELKSEFVPDSDQVFLFHRFHHGSAYLAGGAQHGGKTLYNHEDVSPHDDHNGLASLNQMFFEACQLVSWRSLT